jgi:PAS domain S-box-containing protein
MESPPNGGQTAVLDCDSCPGKSSEDHNSFILGQFGRLFDVTHDLLGVLGFDDRLKFINSSWETTLDYTREELMAGSPSEFLHPDDRAATHADIAKVLAGVPTTAFENRFRCKDGSYRWLSWSSVYSPSERCFYMAARDVTEHKRSEETILRLAQAMESNREMIAMSDADRRAIFANRALLQETGYTEEEILGRGFGETLISPNNPPELIQDFHVSMRRDGRWRGECLLRRKDGSEFPISLSLSTLRDPEGRVTGSFAISQNITEQRGLADRVIRLASALEHNAEMICMSDDKGICTFVNDALVRATGFREEEMVGKSFAETIFSPNNPPNLQRELQNGIVREGKWRGECLQRRRGGPDLPISLSVSVLRDKDGRVTGAFAIAQDITERRELEERLRRAHKMEAVGQLAGGIAHDFNNLLMVIMGYAGDLAERLDESDPLRRKADEICRAGRRAASLTRQLLAFSRQQVLSPRVLNLNVIVEDLHKMLVRVIGENIELVADLAADLGSVKTDQGQMEQVIVNLAVNARDAMPEGGEVTIQTSNFEVDSAFARLHPEMSPGAYVRLVVKDTGTGMDTETQSRIFEPFFTTKERGKGTGLGLATVYGVVKQSQGFIWVYSEPGKGSTFEVLLPRVRIAAEPPQALTADMAAPKIAPRTETILLVEDDEALRNLVVRSLKGHGYSVLPAANGTEALVVVGDFGGKVDLLLTDVAMPGMSGPQVADRILALNPEIKVLYMSGYPEFAAKHEDLLKQGRQFLNKPLTLADLARKVGEMLDNTPSAPVPTTTRPNRLKISS